jgi:hypothetical protein
MLAPFEVLGRAPLPIVRVNKNFELWLEVRPLACIVTHKAADAVLAAKARAPAATSAALLRIFIFLSIRCQAMATHRVERFGCLSH